MHLPSVDDRYLQQFDPYRKSERVSEDAVSYAAKMQQSLLPLWPAEVLIEWLHRYAGHINDYAPLRDFQVFPGKLKFKGDRFI